MVTAVVDPERGVLRLDHAALSVLTTLATRPNDPALRDHAVADVISALRRSGLIGAAGIHAEVAPLMQAVGRAHRTLELAAVDHGVGRSVRVWVGEGLLVAAIVGDDAAYQLMADRVAAGSELLAELVGLSPASQPDIAGVAHVSLARMRELLDGGPEAVDPASVLLADPRLGDPGDEWVQALRQLSVGAGTHWTLIDSRAGAFLVQVIDAGRAGLWRVVPQDDSGHEDRGVLALTTPLEIKAYLDQLIRPPVIGSREG